MSRVVITLARAAEAAGAELRGDPDILIHGVAPLARASGGELSFLANPRLRRLVEETRASAVIVTAADADRASVPVLVAANPLLAFARVASLFEYRPPAMPGIHATAVVDASAHIDPEAVIDAQAVVEAKAVVGPGVYVGPGSVIGAGARIGANSRLVARVTVCHHVVVGDRVTIHPGAVVGADGFGLANDGGEWIKVPQLGSVIIGNDVEIGANTTIDRGALDDTVIEDGVKLDNQIQVAHNVRIGAHTAIAGCVGIAGSVRIGRHCTLGGGVGIAGHLEIVDNVHITGMSLVTKSITQPGVYSSGLAVEPSRIWNKISARLRRLDDAFRRIKALESRGGGTDE